MTDNSYLPPVRFKLYLTLLLSLSILFLLEAVHAQESFVFKQSDEVVALKPHFKVLEDAKNTYTLADVLQRKAEFIPLAKAEIKNKTGSFWLMAHVKSAKQMEASIYFKHLTFARLYFIADTPGAKTITRRAGAFRPSNEITNGDSRFHFSVKLDKDIPYIILIKSRHTKQYLPVFDFYLSERYAFLKNKFSSELNDLWPQGASALLFLYIFLRWITTRHRPFVWLMLFVAAFNLYGIALNRYLIDWFFPHVPHLGWLLPQHFLHLGLLGLYLLLLDSWDVRHKLPNLYKWGRALLYGLVALTITVFITNYYFSNFELAGKITISFLMALLIYSIVLLVKIWNKLSRQELYLAYGLILFFGVILIGSLGVLFFEEMFYNIIPNLAKAISICIAFLFLMGLNGLLRQKELESTDYLKKLNLLQQQQNEILEESVRERTQELSERNAHIETLMNELNHRVKNNLQMLYGLNSLRLSNKADTQTNNILRDNISRIKAMMLVNENLQLNNQSGELELKPFIQSIIRHSKQIFEADEKVAFEVNIPEKFMLSSKLALPLSLIVSELLINSYKHAFAQTASPFIAITIMRDAQKWQLTYADNGCGMQANSVASFGSQLIQDLARQINAKTELFKKEGLTYRFTVSIV